MTQQVVSPGPSRDTVRDADGSIMSPPLGWIFVPPDEEELMSRLKASGAFWAVQDTRGGKVVSRGLWADQAAVERAREALPVTVSAGEDPFRVAVLEFLGFAPRYAEFAERLADLMRGRGGDAEAAVVAWMRQETSGYDDLQGKPSKDERRQFRLQLAGRCDQILQPYRRGEAAPEGCPLAMRMMS